MKNSRISRSGGTKIEGWRRPGGVHGRLGMSWEHFGVSGAVKSSLRSFLGVSWAVWEASRGRLGGVQEPSWGRFGLLWDAMWGVMWAFREGLTGMSRPIFRTKRFNSCMLSWMPFFSCFFDDVASKIDVRSLKTMKLYRKSGHSELEI